MRRVRSRGVRTNFSQIASECSADPGLAVPVRAELPASPELEVKLVRLAQPRRREDLESLRRMDELELAIRLLGGGFEHECLPAAATNVAWPDVHGTTALVDVLANV